MKWCRVLSAGQLLYAAEDVLAQILFAGKISQASVLAAAAYRDEEAFRSMTGIACTRLVIDKDGDTHV